MRIQVEIKRLATLQTRPHPLLSLYLNWERCDGSHWKRIRSVLKRLEREAFQAADSETIRDHIRGDFRAIESSLRKGFPPGTQGVCIFACGRAGIFESHAFPVPFKAQVVVGFRPFLMPLARISDEYDHAVVVLVDTETARLFEVVGGVVLRERMMEGEVPGRHAQGGWAQMRYQRHIDDHRDRHHREVAELLTRWADETRVVHIVLGGQERILANFQDFLPARVRERILTSLPLDIRVPRDEMIRRTNEVLSQEKQKAHQALVSELLDQALVAGRAAVGLKSTLGAINESRVERLLILRAFSHPGLYCPSCEMLHWETVERCPYCNSEEASPVSLEQEIVNATLQQGGEVTTILDHPLLARHGGLGAFFRYH